MEDLITIIIAALVGIFSLLGSRKKQAPPKLPPSVDDMVITDEQGRPIRTGYESGTPPASSPRQAPASESTFDVLGRILRGDFSGFEPQRPRIPADEYSDPAASRRKAREAEMKKLPEIVVRPKAVATPSPMRPALRDRQALREAIITHEILGPPKARQSRLRPR